MGSGRVTKNKQYCIFEGDNVNTDKRIELTGTWSYHIGAKSEIKPSMDFVSWKPTGLYNGMVAPCHNYAICAVIWYQGEANILKPDTYEDYQRRMIAGYREKWGQKNLPFYYVQLPNITADMPVLHSGIPNIREEQERCLTYPNVGMACSIDVGEDNDWHPLQKKEIGDRLGLLVKAHIYKQNVEFSGPTVKNIDVIRNHEKNGYDIIIHCEHANGLKVNGVETNTVYEDVPTYRRPIVDELLDFEVAGPDGHYEPAHAVVEDDTIKLFLHLGSIPAKVRYCHSNTPKGGLIFNSDNLPMAAFEKNI